MNGAVPHFFLSYSQGDTDAYLHQFFEDLRKRVANISGMAINFETDPDREEKLNEIGFRDRTGVKTGQDWMANIGAALQRAGALVCVYSPNFFSRRQTKQFCGREFTAFSMRNRDIRYAPGTGADDEKFQLQGARNVLPIVWLKLSHLQNQKLPPYVVRLIKWSLDSESISAAANARYLKVGMRRITITGGATYDDIVDFLAERIVQLAKNPLPLLPEIPDIEQLRNAFWETPEDHMIDRAGSATAVVESMVVGATGGPGRMLVMEVRRAADIADRPADQESSIRAMLEEVANQKELAIDWMALDPDASHFMDQTLSRLGAAAKESIRPILLVDPRCLANNITRGTLAAVLQRRCRAGFLVLADSSDQNNARLIRQHEAILRPPDDAPDWVVRISIGNAMQLRTAVSSVADDLLARIVKTDPVRQPPPDNSGPHTRPRIANRLNDGSV
jgi:hypothetical protein